MIFLFSDVVSVMCIITIAAIWTLMFAHTAAMEFQGRPSRALLAIQQHQLALQRKTRQLT